MAKKRFAQIMIALGEYYGRELSPQLIDIYWRALDGYDIETIDRAIQRHLKSPDNGQYFPKVADIVRLVSGTSTEAAHTAWAKVEAAVSSVGGWRSVVFDDPLIHAVIQDMGGWIFICERDADEWPFTGKEFRERYVAMARAEGRPRVSGHLVGRVEAENRRMGYDDDIPAPVLIGDAEKARNVLESSSDAPRLAITWAGNG